MPNSANARPRDLDRYRTRLQESLQQLQLDLETSRQRSMSLSGGPDEPGSGQHWERSGYGDHQADDATEVFEREKEIGLAQSFEAHIEQVEHALRRIEAGTYGECESCGKQIPAARLDALPEATLCVDCKTEEEAKLPIGRKEPDTV